jgi:hypothetical protein
MKLLILLLAAGIVGEMRMTDSFSEEIKTYHVLRFVAGRIVYFAGEGAHVLAGVAGFADPVSGDLFFDQVCVFLSIAV